MLNPSNEPICITKQGINDKSIAYFQNLFSIVDLTHVLKENLPNLAYSEFLSISSGLYNEAFPKKKNES